MAEPFLPSRSILAWERESTRGQLPSTSSAWREFGRVDEFQDLGPEWQTFRDPVVGADQEAHEVGTEGKFYGPVTLSPIQLRDPLILGYALSLETNRSEIGTTGFYRHTLGPRNGVLDSIAVAMRDRRADGADQSVVFLETIMPQLAVRGERVGPDGSGGRCMYSPTLLAHDHTTANADQVTVSLDTAEPIRWYHGRIQLDNETIGKILQWELRIDRRAESAYYWRDDAGKGPGDSPPQASVYDFTAEVALDDTQYTSNNRTIRELLRNEDQFDIDIRLARTVDEDETRYNLTNVQLARAPGQRSGNRVVLQSEGVVRKLRQTYVDQNNSPHFSTS